MPRQILDVPADCDTITLTDTGIARGSSSTTVCHGNVIATTTEPTALTATCPTCRREWTITRTAMAALLLACLLVAGGARAADPGAITVPTREESDAQVTDTIDFSSGAAPTEDELYTTLRTYAPAVNGTSIVVEHTANDGVDAHGCPWLAPWSDADGCCVLRFAVACDVASASHRVLIRVETDDGTPLATEWLPTCEDRAQ